MTSVPETNCRCGVETLDDFLQYRNYAGRVLGGRCTKCHHEWLRPEYLLNNDTVVGTPALSRTCVFKKRYKRTPEAFNCYYGLHRIKTLASAVTAINPGDHIWWELKKSNERHAIVESVDRTRGTLTIIQCNKGSVVRVEVTKSRLERLCKDTLHRANYNHEDPTVLTLTRARMWLRESSIPDEFKKTCSSFIVYCKTGSTSVRRKLSSCKCGNNTLEEFRRYILDEVEGLLGLYCKTCGREWIKDEFLPNSKCDDVFLDLFGARLIQNTIQKERVEKGRTPITTAEYAEDMLKVGDHIYWERSCYSHHAIVEKVDTENHTITVIHYRGIGKNKESTKVTRQTLPIEEECQRNLYRVDYKHGEEDPQILTIARARSWLGEGNYHLMDRNCETFSVYCKTGVLISWQIVQYYMDLAKWCLSEVCIQYGIKVTFAEAIERAFESKNMGNKIGAGIVCFIEVLAFVWDLWSLHNEFRSGDITSGDFHYQTIVSAVQRTTNACFVIVISILCQAVGGFLGSLLFPGVGTKVGMFLGSVVGGSVGSIPGQAAGTYLGRKVAGQLCR